ncbi:MAG: hypothetical protein AAF353_00820 [Pseudomonadota bacterium]
MKEIRIAQWTGLCSAQGQMILGLGNDFYQIGVAISEAIETRAARVSFNRADQKREREFGIKGVIALFPDLSDGIEILEGDITRVVDATPVSNHQQMAGISSSMLRHSIMTYLKPYLLCSLENHTDYSNTLVIHLRGGDALDKWAQNEWRPSPAPYEFYQDVIEKSGCEHVMVVTTPPEKDRIHPYLERIRSEYGADVQHGAIFEDFSTLMHCENLVLDFSTFGYTAALMNSNLKQAFVSRFVDKTGFSLLPELQGDAGYTLPEIEGCEVFVYDHPEFVVKVETHSKPRSLVAGTASNDVRRPFGPIRGWRVVTREISAGGAWDVHRLAFFSGGEEITGTACSSGFVSPEEPEFFGPANAFDDGSRFWGGRVNSHWRCMLGLTNTGDLPVEQVLLEQGQNHFVTSLDIEVLVKEGNWFRVGTADNLRPGTNNVVLAYPPVHDPQPTNLFNVGFFGPPAGAGSLQKHSGGKEGPPQLVVIRERDVGLFSLFLQVVNTVQAIEPLVLIPIVWFDNRCVYFKEGGYRGRKTVWEYYFEPIDPDHSEDQIPDLQNLKGMENTIYTSDYYPDFAAVPDADRIPFLSDVNDHHRRIGANIVSKYIRPRDYIVQKVEGFYFRQLSGHFVIGMHIRGTDAIGSLMREKEVEIVDYAAEADRIVSARRSQGESGFRIFVATDDEKYVDGLRARYGERLVCYDAIRKRNESDKGAGPTGALMPDYIANDPDVASKNGEDVVVEYMLLCKSDYFIYNISSVSRAVLITCPDLNSHNVQPYASSADQPPRHCAEDKMQVATVEPQNTALHRSDKVTVIQGGLPGSGFGSYFFLEIVGLIDDLLRDGRDNFVVVPNTHDGSLYFPRKGTPTDNLWTTFFEPINLHLLDELGTGEVEYTNYDANLHVQEGRIKAWPFNERPDLDLDDWFRQNRIRGSEVVRQYFVPKQDIRRRVESLWKERFEGASSVLGVHLRGTDKLAAGERRIVQAEEYFLYLDSFLEAHPNGKLFVATDDLTLLNSLKQAGYPVCCQEAFRSSGRTGLFDLPHEKGPEEHGREVLIDIYMLSRCNYLIHGFSSVVEGAMFITPDLHNQSINLEYEKPQDAPW